MGDPVTGAGRTPANQTTYAGQSGAASPADAAKFGETLEGERLCPTGLGRTPHVAGMPPRYDPPCHYLQQSKPDLTIHKDVGERRGIVERDPPKPPFDYKKGPKEPDQNPLSGVTLPKGATINDAGKDGGKVMVPVTGTPQEESPEQTPVEPPGQKTDLD